MSRVLSVFGTALEQHRGVYFALIFAGFLLVTAAPARADTPGQWVSDSTGQPIATPTVTFSRTNFFDGSVSLGGGGLSFELDAGHVLFNASPVLGSVSSPQIWSNVYAWDNPILYVSAFENSVQYLENGNFITASTDHGITPISIQGLTALGPSSTTVSVPVPYTAGILNFGTHVEFNVQLNSGRGMILDQDATIQTLNIDSGAYLQSLSGKNLTVNGPLINNGELFLSGSANTQSLVNSGQMTVATGGSLSVSSPFANDGSLNIAGGYFSTPALTNYGNITLAAGSLSGDITNRGTFAWSGGYLSNNFTNSSTGSLTISGTAAKYLAPDRTLANSGTINQVGNGTILYLDNYNDGMNGSHYSTLNNLVGGVYDIQGDGTITASYNGAPAMQFQGDGRIINAGTFRKSVGTETAVVGTNVPFTNTGTVEVTSGTLNFQGGGSSTNGNFSFANSGRILLATPYSYAMFVLSGHNTAIGNGTLEIASEPVRAGYNEAATLVMGNGSTLLLSGGVLSGGTGVGGDLTLDSTGTGAIRWTGGYIFTSFRVNGEVATVTNASHDFAISGSETKGITSSATLNNRGTIKHGGDSTTILAFYGLGNGYGGINQATLNNQEGAVYDLQGNGGLGTNTSGSFGAINNAGTFRKSAGTGESIIGILGNGNGVTFRNTGIVEADSGTLTFNAGFTQTAGYTNLNGGNIAFSGAGQFQGGLLTGSGTITGSVLNTGAVLSPGHSPGVIDITGDYTQGADATLLIELAGKWTGQYDILDVAGRANLGGTLELSFLNGFRPALGDSFSILNFGSYSGSFSTIQVLGNPNYQFALQYTATDLTLTTTSVPEPASLGLLAFGSLTLLRRYQHKVA